MPDDDKAPAAVLGISLEAKFNASRSVVFQTHVPLGADPKEIYRQFAKICDIADRREEFYLLKGLHITLERDEEALKSTIDGIAKLQTAYEKEYISSGRKGAFRLAGQQKTNIDNQQSGAQALRDRIAKVKSEIAELEKLQKAYE